MKLFTRIKMFFEMVRILRIRGVVRDKGWRWVLVETYRECFLRRERKAVRIDLAEFRHKYGPIWPTPIGGGFIIPPQYLDQPSVVKWDGLYLAGTELTQDQVDHIIARYRELYKP